MKISETVGKILGIPLGVLTFGVSFLRNARTFHPTGILAHCTVKTFDHSPVRFHPYALARFTGAIWKHNQKLPDVLGISFRFSEKPVTTTTPLKSDQDLLFASFRLPVQTPIAPFMTKYHKFFLNTFYAISPFQTENDYGKFSLTIREKISEGSRMDNMRLNIKEHATLLLRFNGEGVAEITLEEEKYLDQEELRFNPYRNGLGIYPRGLVHSLRIFVYPMSQSGRAFRHRLQKIF